MMGRVTINNPLAAAIIDFDGYHFNVKNRQKFVKIILILKILIVLGLLGLDPTYLYKKRVKENVFGFLCHNQ